MPIAPVPSTITNECYSLTLADGGAMLLTPGMSPQRIIPEFTVLLSERDPGIFRNFNHPNHPIAPRPAVRWRNATETAESLTAWLASPTVHAGIQYDASVRNDPVEGLVWEYRDKTGRTAVRVAGKSGEGATRPFTVGEKRIVRAAKISVTAQTISWEFAPQPEFALSATLTLPAGNGDPELSLVLTPKQSRFFSVAFTGAPATPRTNLVRAPQECAGPYGRQGDFVLSEADLKLPRVFTATKEGCFALVAAPSECRFRLPALEDSRFGLMRSFDQDAVRPVLIAPLLGGAESRMVAGKPWKFTMRLVAKAGDWKVLQQHVACGIFGLHDDRDNSGPGSLNATLERVMDFLDDRNGHNYAMWSDEQKYYDYFTDQTGVFKPFSPLYGLGAALATDDEAFFRRRVRPAIEFALSRRYNLFAPFEGVNRRIVKAAASNVGAPYIGYAQLISLHEMLQQRSPVLRALADQKPVATIPDFLARWRITGKPADLEAAWKSADGLLKTGNAGAEHALFDYLELYDATKDARALRAVVEAAYERTVSLNLYPMPPATQVTVDAKGVAPVHRHSFGRHKNIWGFLEPVPVPAPEVTVPAWRIARLGLASPAYPIEYWMNTHGALLRAAAVAGDDFLRDVARWGMVGRFGNYPGDNRSHDSLIAERPDAVETPPWNWNFATVNPGHAWDFAGAIIDWLVSDAFHRSGGAIDFPAHSAAGSQFRVRLYGAAPGHFYGETNVHLWLPKGLLASDDRELDWLAAYGNGQLYLAFLNQSSHETRAQIHLKPELAVCPDGPARQWRNNQIAEPLFVQDNRFGLAVPAKGIVALTIPAAVKPRFQANLLAADNPALGAGSFQQFQTSFGQVHAMLLRAGKGLTSAYIYTDASAEDVIAARLLWRQGAGAWHEMTDAIFPYEFSIELSDDGGDFQCCFEVEDTQQKIQNSPVLVLKLTGGPAAPAGPPPLASSPFIAPFPRKRSPAPESFRVSDDFLGYLKGAANPQQLGLRGGRFYPYSTPLGRRIAYGLEVWDKALYAQGCTPAEATARLRAELAQCAGELTERLARQPNPVSYDRLPDSQRELLLDFALSETTVRIPANVLAAILANDWRALKTNHAYIRYAGNAPDHNRNLAFARRWKLL
ncbi:MAG: hypothetical protein WCO56_01945 [Verrucomicrobiota bacterium]